MKKYRVHYSEFANMVDCREMLGSIKRTLDGTSTEWQKDWIDSNFVQVGGTGWGYNEIWEIVKDEENNETK